MTTIYEIAEKTGFSPSTVSRALSNSGYCSPKTKAIVLEAAHQLNYIPSSAGRALKSKQTKRILFCIPDILNPFYFEMIRGTTDVLDKHGYYSMLCYTKHKLKEELKFLRLLAEQYGDGMIMVSFNFNEKNMEAIRNSPFPIVTTNPYQDSTADENYDTVYVDHTQAMYLATEHLVSLGHREIALIIGDLNEQTSRERADGYRACMDAYQLPYDDSNFFIGDYTKESGERAAKQLLKSEKQYTAIVTANDLMAMGLMIHFAKVKIRVPDDYSLISLDNTDYAQTLHPALTSVDMKQYAIGSQAAEFLMERFRGERTERKVEKITPELIIRDSTKALQ